MAVAASAGQELAKLPELRTVSVVWGQQPVGWAEQATELVVSVALVKQLVVWVVLD